MSDSKYSRGLGAAARVTALAGSVMDLHVRIALQEMDREKRRLISGVVFLIMGGCFLVFSLLAAEITLALWLKNSLVWNLEWILLLIIVGNLALAGLTLRVGGQLAKGPYLPETWEGLAKTTKAVLGKP